MTAGSNSPPVAPPVALRQITLREDQWLTHLLPVRCINVHIHDSQPDAPLTSDDLVALKPPTGFATLRLAVARARELPLLLDMGWRPAAVTLNWHWSVDRDMGVGPALPPDPHRNAANVKVRPAASGDQRAIRALAEAAFSHSRYFADPGFPGPWARQVKGEWAANLASGVRGHGCLVAEWRGRVGAFLGYLDVTGGTAIDLIATSPECRGRGLGVALITTLQARIGCAKTPHRLMVATQATNTPSIGLYQRCGFHLAPETQIVLHAGP